MVRRTLALAVLLAVAFSGLVPSPAQGGERGNVINVTKVVEGDVPAGTTFTIEVTCNSDGGTDVTPLVFDAAGGTQTVTAPTIGDCSAEETDDGGAITVTYACRIDDPGNQNEPSTCQGDRTVQIDARETEATITVTNTFAAEDVGSDDVATEPDVVAATPTFTG